MTTYISLDLPDPLEKGTKYGNLPPQFKGLNILSLEGTKVPPTFSYPTFNLLDSSGSLVAVSYYFTRSRLPTLIVDC